MQHNRYARLETFNNSCPYKQCDGILPLHSRVLAPLNIAQPGLPPLPSLVSKIFNISEEFADWCSALPEIELGPMWFDPAALTTRPWIYGFSRKPTTVQT